MEELLPEAFKIRLLLILLLVLVFPGEAPGNTPRDARIAGRSTKAGIAQTQIPSTT